MDTTEYITVDGGATGIGDAKCFNGGVGHVCTLASIASQEPSMQPSENQYITVDEEPTTSPTKVRRYSDHFALTGQSTFASL
jgi:hypothetical protein